MVTPIQNRTHLLGSFKLSFTQSKCSIPILPTTNNKFISQIQETSFHPQIESHADFDVLKEYMSLFGKIKPPHVAKPLNDLNNLIIFDRNYIEYMKDKEQISHMIPDKVFIALPGHESAAEELLNLIIQQYPNYFERQGPYIRNKITKEEWDLRDSSNHPLKVVGRLVPADIFLNKKIDDKYILVAGSAHLTSKWRLSDKIGKTVAQVHYEMKNGIMEGVPIYKDQLEKRVDSYFEQLKIEKPSIRFVTLVHQEASWSQHPDIYISPEAKNYTIDNIGDELTIRTERETFKRLENNSDYIVMNIHPFYAPLKVIEERPDLAKHFYDLHAEMPEAYRNYRSDLKVFFNPLMAYLKKYGG